MSFKQIFKRRRVKRGHISYVPSCLFLSVAYAFTGFLLLWPGRGLPRHDKFGYLEGPLGIAFVLFALWHACGYLGIVKSDDKRKIGFLVSSIFMAGFGTLLFSDGSYLSGGYVILGAFVACYSYWRYPRRNECGST